MSYLLDTNIVSEVRKPQSDAHVRAWFASVPDERLYLSVLTIGEIRRGIERLRGRDPAQTAVFDDWLGALQHRYADRLLPVTADVAQEWGRLNVPDPLPTIDGLLTGGDGPHPLSGAGDPQHGRRSAQWLDPFRPQHSGEQR